MAIDHDQNFKTLIKSFFREFMELFLPKEAALIDFSRIEFLEQEVFTDAPKGKRKRLDLVVKAGLKAGGDEFVLVHHEFQSEKEPGFPKRMCLCFFDLFKGYDKVVVPVAIFTDDAVWRDPIPDSFSIRLNREYLRFQYHLVKLKHLDYRKYLKSENPLAYALMAKMNFDKREALRLKGDFFRLITGSRIDDARKALLLQFVDTYMPLDKKEQQKFDRILSEGPEFREVRKMTTTWELRGLRKGRREGLSKGRREGLSKGRREGLSKGRREGLSEGRREGLSKGRREGKIEGEIEGKRTALLLQMEKKFGKLDPDVKRKVLDIQSAERLEALTLAILDAESLDELGL